MPGGGPTNALRSWLTSVRPDPRTPRRDAAAGVPGAIGSLPDGIAAAVLAGVNPIHGLDASFAAPIAGGLA
jgi:sulfate permease, SulP family